ncbi:histidine phosphatase superfamily [Pelagophyceae sp. CCMP2097]|nr:histidine phosphatase superfamily [Pelagophyceae sp. CCMP2097]|mmetsp:Transcript_10791/g.37357  ORF Transcript_10791/g.37357 Transcript_10791/m.37357 type:complete len:465 (+) Transcript_10791:95-1489(+)
MSAKSPQAKSLRPRKRWTALDGLWCLAAAVALTVFAAAARRLLEPAPPGAWVPARGQGDYCSAPVDAGAEGAYRRTHDLAAVALTIRHGARNAIVPLPWKGRNATTVADEAAEVARGYDCALTPDNERLVRRWEEWFDIRTLDGAPPPAPRSFRAEADDAGRCAAPGQLVDRGFRQHITLGRHLRRAYDSPERAWAVTARSTDYQRTRASAAALLSGLLYDGDASRPAAERVAIDFNADAVGEGMHGKGCARATKEASHEYASYLMGPDVHLRAARLFEPVDVGRPTELGDGVFSALCERGRLPCGGGGCVSGALVRGLKNESDAYYCARYLGGAGGAAATRLRMAPLVGEIAAFLARTADEWRPGAATRLQLLSGHDVVVAPLAAALGFFDCKWPPLASRVVFELWRPRRRGGRALFRCLYNGVDVTRSIPGCDADLCPVEALAAVRDALIAPHIDQHKACKL